MHAGLNIGAAPAVSTAMFTNTGSHELFAHRLLVQSMIRIHGGSDLRVVDLTADAEPIHSPAERVELQRFVCFQQNLHAAGSA